MSRPTSLQLQVYRKYLQPFVVFEEEEWNVFSEQLYVKTIKKRHRSFRTEKFAMKLDLYFAALSGSFL